MIRTVTGFQTLIAAALALTGQGVLSDETSVKAAEQEVVRVTTPRPAGGLEAPAISTDARETVEALRRQLARDLERQLDAIGKPRVELVIAEVPTRG